MSAYKEVDRFLDDVTRHLELRSHFSNLETGEEFITTCQTLGYNFDAKQFKQVVKSHSRGVEFRRESGVWGWLRSIKTPLDEGMDDLEWTSIHPSHG